MPHARRLIELRRALAAELPQSLMRLCSVANFKQGRVVVFAANSPVAAKLRLLGPKLLEQLSRRGFEVTGMDVRVQPFNNGPQPFEKSAQMTQGAGEKLARLTEQLPDSELKTVIDRLSRRKRT